MGDDVVIRLVLGGDKSGKSAFALSLLRAGAAPRLLAVTGRALDMAFREQIQAHKRERPADIPVADCGPHLARVFLENKGRGGTVLADSMDFWLFSNMESAGLGKAREELLKSLEPYAGTDAPDAILVSVEAGLGAIAERAGVRAFVRELGALNQALAAMAHEVHLVVAGLPLRLKGK